MNTFSTSSIKHILWDWNGTLLNDVELTVEVTNEVLVPHGGPSIDIHYHRRNFLFPVADYYHHLGFPPERLDHAVIHSAWGERYEARKIECDLHEGAHGVLGELTTRGFKQAILSAYPEDLLRETVAHHKIETHFRGIFGNPTNDGTSKLQTARRLLHELAIDPAEALIVGDTHHDAEIGGALGCPVILVSHGHQDHARLATTPHPVCRTLHEVSALLKRD
jgi:phosphoglycolate phosphatase